MFPKLKPKAETNKINKEELCSDHCNELINANEKKICSKYIPEIVDVRDEEEVKKKVSFSADGVYYYYKNFVSHLLDTIGYAVSKIKELQFKIKIILTFSELSW